MSSSPHCLSPESMPTPLSDVSGFLLGVLLLRELGSSRGLPYFNSNNMGETDMPTKAKCPGKPAHQIAGTVSNFVLINPLVKSRAISLSWPLEAVSLCGTPSYTCCGGSMRPAGAGRWCWAAPCGTAGPGSAGCASPEQCMCALRHHTFRLTHILLWVMLLWVSA